MRITYLSSSHIPSRSANSIQVMKMCRAFFRNGHEVTLFSAGADLGDKSSDDFAYYGVEPCFEIVKCRHPKIKMFGGALHVFGALRVIRERPRPDLFYSRYIYNLFAVSSWRIPMILEVHDIPPNGLAKMLMDKLFEQVHLRRLVAISKAMAKEYQRIFPRLSADKIVVAHDGADALCIDQDFFISPWPGRAGILQVGYTGHLYPGKGIEVITAMARELPDFDFHIIGGTQEDIAKWGSEYAKSNLFFHGYVPPGEVSRLSAQFDVVLAPYQEQVAVSGGKGNVARWMSPLKIFEYMALGKPIICSDLPVLREVLTDQVTAILVPPSDIHAWVQALSLLEKNPGLRDKIGKAARNVFRSSYTWEKRAAAVLDCF